MTGPTRTDAVLDLPFYCPIEPAIHPEAEAAEVRALAWIDRMGFAGTDRERARAAGTRSAEFWARFAPQADPDRLWVTACWVYWGFAFDDARCDEDGYATDPAGFTAMAGAVQRALEVPGPPTTTDPYATALHDLGERFRTCATPVQVRRFQNAHRAWLAGVQWQIGNRARGHVPTLDSYLTMRLHSAGGEPTYAMLEIANGAEVPAHEMDSPAVCALTEMAVCVAALDNDRHSLAREAGHGQTGQNVIGVLMHHDRTPPDRALRDAVALRDTVLARFLDLSRTVRRRAGTELARYVDDLAHGIRGNIDWGLRVPRYLCPSGAGPGRAPAPRGPALSETPLTGPHDPRSIPTTAWWWHDLA